MLFPRPSDLPPVSNNTNWNVDPITPAKRRLYDRTNRPLSGNMVRAYNEGGMIRPYPISWSHKPQWIEGIDRYVGLNSRDNRAELIQLLKCDPAKGEWCDDFTREILRKHNVNIPRDLLWEEYKKWGQEVGPVPGSLLVNPLHVEFLTQNNRIRGAFVGGNDPNREGVGFVYKNEQELGPFYDGGLMYAGRFFYPKGYRVPRQRPTPDEIWNQANRVLPSDLPPVRVVPQY